MTLLQNAASLARKELSGAFSSRPLVLLKLEENQLEFRISPFLPLSTALSSVFLSLSRSFSCFIDKREKGTSTYDAKSRSNRISRISSDVRTITEWKKQKRGETEAHQTPKWKPKERKSDGGKNRKRWKKEGERREIVIFKIDTRQRRVERAASRGWVSRGMIVWREWYWILRHHTACWIYIGYVDSFWRTVETVN